MKAEEGSTSRKRKGSRNAEKKRIAEESGSCWRGSEGNGKQRSKVAGQNLLDCVVFNVRKDAEVKGRIRSGEAKEAEDEEAGSEAERRSGRWET